MISRRTLSQPTESIRGFGLHSGAPSSVRILPFDGSSGDGLRFRAADGPEAAIAPESVVDTRRCTTIDVCGTRFATVEHLLSALGGLGVTDAVVEFSGPEAPILDGSSAPFCAAIARAGLVDLRGFVEPLVVSAPIDICGRGGERIIAVPCDRLRLTVVLEYPDRSAIGVQAAVFDSGDDYAVEVAPARTYGFLSELEQVRAAGLATGASLENCIALCDDGSPDERTPLRFSNELARHKLLDLMGDLTVLGRPVQAHMVALRPGHAVNSAMALRLAAG